MMTRRTLLSKAALPVAMAAATALPAAALGKAGQVVRLRFPASDVSPALRALIREHRAAHAHFESVCYLSDSIKLGRVPTPREKAICGNASNAEAEALSRVCRFPAISVADMRAKGRHLQKFNSWRYGELRMDQVDALLRSMRYAGKAGAA